MKFFVEIRSVDKGELVKRLGPHPSEQAAEKAERGVNINLNNRGYYTNVVEGAE